MLDLFSLDGYLSPSRDENGSRRSVEVAASPETFSWLGQIVNLFAVPELAALERDHLHAEKLIEKEPLTSDISNLKKEKNELAELFQKIITVADRQNIRTPRPTLLTLDSHPDWQQTAIEQGILSALNKESLKSWFNVDQLKEEFKTFQSMMDTILLHIDSTDPTFSAEKQAYREQFSATLDKLESWLPQLNTSTEDLKAEIDDLRVELEFMLPARSFSEAIVEDSKAYMSFLTNSYQELDKEFKEFFGAISEKEVEGFQKLVGKIKTGELIEDSDLVILNAELKREKRLLQTVKTFQDRLKELLYDKPLWARSIVRVVAISAAHFAGGPQAGMSANVISKKLMEQILPADPSAESKPEKIARYVTEAVGAYLVGGAIPGLISAGNNLLEETAPAPIREAVEVAIVANAANHYGSPLFSALGIPLGRFNLQILSVALSYMTLALLKNIKILKSFLKDLKYAWDMTLKEPWKAIPRALHFSLSEVANNGHEFYVATREGKVIQAVVRLSLFLILGVGMALRVSTLFGWPLLVAFYVVNKAYSLRYEGEANLDNPKFREYLIQIHNETDTKLLEALRGELAENASLHDIIDFIEKKAAEPTAARTV